MADVKIIERKKLLLREIEPEEYVNLCDYWDGRVGFKPKGYALIAEPLTSPNYQTLLRQFLETPFARRVSYMRADNSWERRTTYELKEDGGIERAVIGARQAGFIFLQFTGGGRKGGVNHEIGWEQCEEGGPLVSIEAKIPGYLRHEYDWHGKDAPYFMIGALWVPEHEAKILCPSLTRASASPPTDQPSHPDPGQ